MPFKTSSRRPYQTSMDNTPQLRNSKPLIIASWNACSLYPKRHELENFLTDEGIDIMLIQETFLRPCTTFKTPNYVTYRNDRPGRMGGGTAILIKRNIHHTPHQTPALEHIEATAIKITIKGKDTLVASIYIPPTPAGAPIKNDLCKLTENTRFAILMGDFNARNAAWGNGHTTQIGNQVFNFCLDKNYTASLPAEPTHFFTNQTRSGSSTIDFALTKGHTVTVHVRHALSSDHIPIVVDTNEEANILSEETRVTNWKATQENLNNLRYTMGKLTSSEDINNEAARLTNELQTILKTNTKHIPKRMANYNRLPEDIRNIIKERNKNIRKYSRNLDPTYKRIAATLTKEIKTLIRNFRTERWESFLNEINEDNTHAQLWKLTKQLKNKNENTKHHLHGNRGLVFADEDKPETFAEALEQQFILNPAEPDNSDSDSDDEDDNEQDEDEIALEAQNIIRNEDHGDPPIRPTSKEELQDIIKRSKNRKAPGEDEIPTRLLKTLPDHLIEILTQLFNGALITQTFPNCWKQASIIMIRKPNKDPIFPQNWRPISLLSQLGKLLEKILKRRLIEELDNKQILPDEQFGFRQEHSTEHQLLRFQKYIADEMSKKGQNIIGVMLDVEKAFDRVWHEGLIVKMHNLNINHNLIKLTASFLKERSYKVKHAGHTSRPRQLNTGVPQGSPASPILYNIYTADIPKNNDTLLGLFADDTAIFASDKNLHRAIAKTQTHLKQLQKWTNQWKIKINAEKTEAIHFTNKKILGNKPALKWKNTRIEWKNNVKYLGLTFNNKMSWKPHWTIKKTQANTIYHKIAPLCNNKTVHPKIKKMVLKQIIIPTITYAAPVWINTNKTTSTQTQKLINSLIRRIFKIPWYIRNQQIREELEIQTTSQFAKDRAAKIQEQMINHQNPIMRQLGGLPPTPNNKRIRCWKSANLA